MIRLTITETGLLAAMLISSHNNNDYDIDNTNVNDNDDMCKMKLETISHIVYGCPKLANREYDRRHDWMERALH